MGDICIHAESTPGTISFKNITPVIPPFNPPLEGDILWRLLSNMSLNYIALTDIAALKAIISAYDFRARHDRPRARVLEKMLQGMVSISCRPTDRLHNGRGPGWSWISGRSPARVTCTCSVPCSMNFLRCMPR